MVLVRYNPWQELNALERHINGLLGDTKVPSTRLEKGFVRVPAAELHETDDAIHLKLELPGLSAKDLDIQVTQDAVHISGERKSETQTQDKGITKSEFYYGKFQRVIPLSARVQNTNVTADYKDGILNLTLPKTEQEKNKVVKVNLEESAA
ncbi:MAG: Hsp20/alpha crystallin family protein [Nostoc sp. DedSLP03]|uniref:Hsp20/alpha crystallin family protein n=1 Tax=Nostoc sp. DedSLP03 TaxID=3075400 RepID=UPI002AD43A9E|nr:Hsp20/alpha crystallin family protein [Nostoc sp. DedSLP03]MDZ7965148.1 Hsp20/alpha crystallin family protein [Nostoc sp. DedSLP03]